MPAFESQRRFKRSKHAIRDRDDGFWVEAFQHDRKFVASHPGYSVERTDAGAKAVGDDDEKSVTGTMPGRVVDRFEVVHVEEHDPDWSARPFGPDERLTKTIAEQSSIGKPREWILQRFDLAGFPA